MCADDSAEKDDFLSSDDEIDIPERDTSTSIFEEKVKRQRFTELKHEAEEKLV